VNSLSPELKKQILALNPETVGERELREILSQAPAPQIISIHGGLLPIKTGMSSFAAFLIGMGYPATSIRNPGNGDWTYGYYDSSDMIAGTVAWHYERTGLRPMIIGHSLGGIQAVRVLYKLACDSTNKIAVWNPLTGKEPRVEITDPLTGVTRPVVGLQVSFVAVALAGGLGRVVPSAWDMNSKLRIIPDSVEEFAGFQKGFDLLGGDYLGFGPANDYHAAGRAIVRNVRLPLTGSHWSIPYAQRLLKDQAMRDWINNYQPARGPSDAANVFPESGSMKSRSFWAAEVWYGIKKHWVLELQRLIQAQSAHLHES
jgi:hypothetical protein